MYKCTECGQEYEQKPEYCDCGNNTFEEIKETQEKQEIRQEIPAAVQTQTFEKESVSSPSSNNLYLRHDERIDNKSLAIFILCIILSILSLIFIGRPSKEEQAAQKQTKPQTEKKTQKNMQLPSINEIWNSTPPKSAAPTQTPVQQNAPQNNNASNQPIIRTIYKIVPNIQQQTPKTQSAAPKATAPKSKKTTAPAPVQKNTTSSKPKTTPAASKPKQATQVNTAQARQELLNYKIILRNKIASKINFLSVVGDGDCVISFKISSSGKLTNRAFSKQSDNDSLNDAVYNAMMQTPAFNPPPAAYKNETLKLSVKMYGGNFEVDLN